MILKDRDTNPAPDGTLDERVCYLQNWRSDVVALVTDSGGQVEQVLYEPYGTPFGLSAGDTDSDGEGHEYPAELVRPAPNKVVEGRPVIWITCFGMRR